MTPIEETLRQHFHTFSGGALCIFGEWFGRPADNHHYPAGYCWKRNILTIHFKDGETLIVWNPGNLLLTDNMLLVTHADQVRWEWYTYGRPQVPDNRHYIHYERQDDSVHATRREHDIPHTCSFTTDEAAVSMTCQPPL